MTTSHEPLTYPLVMRFTHRQMEMLNRIKKKTGAPRNEIVRRFVDRGIERWLLEQEQQERQRA